MPVETPVDKSLLLAHLNSKTKHPNLLIHAVIQGLITAVVRGDFDEKRDEN